MPSDAISICHSYPHTGALHIRLSCRLHLSFLPLRPTFSFVIYTFQIILLYMDYVSGIPSTPVVASFRSVPRTIYD